MKRLLVICHGYPPYYGGAEHVAAYLAREAVKAGHQVTVLTSDIGGRLPEEEILEGCRILRMPAPKKEWTRHTVRELWGFQRVTLRRIRKLVREEKPDYCLAHFSVPAGTIAKRIKKIGEIPFAVVCHGSDVPGYQSKRFGFIYPFLRPIVRTVWSEAAHVIAVSEQLKQLALQTWPNGNVHVLENGVDTEHFCPAERTHRNPGPFRIIIVAQLIERKGIQNLIKALPELTTDERKKLKVSVYGTGPYLETLEQLVDKHNLKKQITFKGLLEHDQLIHRLRQADLFALPSYQEGLPLSLLEAMSAGLPVMATRVGGIPDVVSGDCGWLIEPGDKIEMVNVIRQLLADPSQLEKVAQAARSKALRYDWSEVWKRYESLMGLRPEQA